MILGAPPGDPRRDRTLARYGVGAIVVNAFEYNSGTLYPLVLAWQRPRNPVETGVRRSASAGLRAAAARRA